MTRARPPAVSPAGGMAYLLAFGVSALAAGAAIWAHQWVGSIAALLFVLAVGASAWYGGFGPGALAAILSALTLAFFLLPPTDFSSPASLPILGELLVFVVVMVFLTALLARSRQAESHAHQATRTERDLLEFAGALSGAGLGLVPVLEALQRELERRLPGAFVLHLARHANGSEAADDAGPVLHLMLAHHTEAALLAGLREAYAAPVRGGDGLLARAMRSEHATALPNTPAEALRADVKARYWPQLEHLAGYSLLAIPLSAPAGTSTGEAHEDARPIGVLTLFRAAEAPPHRPGEIAFAEAVARTAAPWLAAALAVEAERAALHAAEARCQAAEANVQDLAKLQASLGVLAQAQSPEQVLDACLAQGLILAGADVGAIHLLDRAVGTLALKVSVGYPETGLQHLRHLPLDAASAEGAVALSGDAAWLSKRAGWTEAYPRLAPAYASLRCEALAVVPVGCGERITGTLTLGFGQVRSLEPSERQRLLDFATLASHLLSHANARVADRKAHALADAGRDRAEYLVAVSARLGASLHLPATLEAVAQVALERLGDFCVVYALGPDSFPLGWSHAHAAPEQAAALASLAQSALAAPGRAHSVLSELLRSGRTVLLPEVGDNLLATLPEEGGLQQSMRSLAPRSLLVVPLATGERMVGVLLCGSASRRLEATDQALAQAVAPRAARAVDHALRHAVAQSLNAELEERIQERTEELQATIEKLEAEIGERERAQAQLELSHEQLRGLSARLEAAREAERARIAREVHDDLGQQLSALKLDIAWLRQKLREQQEPLLSKTKAMAELLDTTVESVRKITQELRPGILDDVGLPAALEWQAQEFQTRSGIESHFIAEVSDVRLPPESAVAIFRVFQEALANVARHAGASRVEVTLDQRDGHMLLRVDDNGRGISEREINGATALGLLGMRERISLLGGEVDIRGSPNQGTTVLVRVPLPGPNGSNGHAAGEPAKLL